MSGESDGDVPLHDEAKARSKWRGGETDDRASEIDDAAGADREGTGDAEGGLLEDLAQRPPD